MSYGNLGAHKQKSGFSLFVFCLCGPTYILVGTHRSLVDVVHHNTRRFGPRFLVSPICFSIPSRVTLNHPRHSFGAITHYPTDFGKWTDFSLCLLFFCQYITFSRWSSVPAADKKAVERADPAISAHTMTKTSVTRFGLGFSTNYSRFQTEKAQNELEGEGSEDCIRSVRFFLVGSFER